MKKIVIITGLLFSAAAIFVSCDSKRQPGKIYMPDMAYSRAYESYAELDSNVFTMDVNNKGHKIYYNSSPVNGTVKQGELFPYTVPHDTNGYKISGSIKNPFDTIKISEKEMEETGRLYNINCGICHGAKGDGNGPLGTTGKIGGIANLTLPAYKDMADGTMFYSITYGKNNMGSYASQLDRKQRWMVIKYVRNLQGGEEPVKTEEPKTDSTATAAEAK